MVRSTPIWILVLVAACPGTSAMEAVPGASAEGLRFVDGAASSPASTDASIERDVREAGSPQNATSLGDAASFGDAAPPCGVFSAFSCAQPGAVSCTAACPVEVPGPDILLVVRCNSVSGCACDVSGQEVGECAVDAPTDGSHCAWCEAAHACCAGLFSAALAQLQ